MRRSLLLLSLLAGCVARPSLESRMAAYTGASTKTLVESLGVPDKQITVDGVQYLAYAEHHTELTPSVGFGPYFGGGPFYGPFYGGGLYGGGLYGGGFYGGGLYGGGIPPQVVEYSCVTTFMLHDDKVVSFTLRGNDCG